MKPLKILLTLYLLLAVALHVYDFFSGLTEEGPVSHLLHLVSYGLSAYLLWFYLPRAQLLMLGACLYPFAYHLHCAVQQAMVGEIAWICWLVVLLQPLTVFVFFRQRSEG